jgi:hypothetical protein
MEVWNGQLENTPFFGGFLAFDWGCWGWDGVRVGQLADWLAAD